MMTPAGALHGRVAMMLGALLHVYARQHKRSILALPRQGSRFTLIPI
jgi:hypothetical protein